jgi:ribosomal 50S subunit-associated protein YjgA (DUF615 family)
MNTTQRRIAKGRDEFAKTVVMYEALAKSDNEIVAEGSAAMAEIVRSWATNDEKCEALGFKCGA